MSTPELTELSAKGTVRAVVLVLHGGRASSHEPTSARQLAVLRMVPLARAVHRQLARCGAAVWLLRNSVRGWNDPLESPVADARWALQQVRERYGDVPVLLVGHSMGGRTALRVADDPRVAGVVALAPWLPAGEPVEPARGRHLLLAHGDADVVTSPAASKNWARRARDVAASVEYVAVRADTHAMLRWPVWHRLTAAYAQQLLALPCPETATRPGAG